MLNDTTHIETSYKKLTEPRRVGVHRERVFCGSRFASEHLQYVSTCDARTKKAVVTNLSDVSNLIADWGDLVDSRNKPLLYVRGTAQTLTSSLLRLWREEQGRDLT
jgi:hypothetical protein